MQENFNNDIADLGLADDVVVTGYVSDEQLANLYRYAYAFAYPTWYEGFGLPVLEAMNFSKPVIASNVTSIPEITGESAVLTSPGDIDQLSDALIRIEADEMLYESLVEKEAERLKLFSWERSALQVLDIYARLMS